MTITIGWWAIPTLITIGLFGWAFTRPYQRASGWGIDITPLFDFGVAIIGSLLAWVVYLAIRLALA